MRTWLLVLVALGCKREPVDDTRIAHPLLWSATKGGTTTYLMGTMHIGIDAAQQLPALVFEKLDASTKFAMETDVDDAALRALMTRTDGTLRDELGPVYWNKLEAALGADQARAIDGMKPMVAATLLSMRGLPRTPPMDQVLRDRARAAGAPIVYLETAADELAVLELHMDRRAVTVMLDDLDRGVAMSRQTAAAYRRGDEVALAKIVEAERTHALGHGYTAEEYDRLVEDLLYRRNAAWIPAIERMGGGFVAVGAMHLVGPRSVRELLAQRGYTLARLAP